MFLMYLIAFIPAIIGAVLWIAHKKVVWWEWGTSVVIGFLVASIVLGITIKGMTGDHETWSGYVTGVTHEPRWMSTHQVAVYRTVTDSKGNSRQVFSHYRTEYHTHGPNWTAYGYFGKKTKTLRISQEKYKELQKRFGGQIKTVRGSRPSYYSGDRNDYHLVNNTNWKEPLTISVSFTNKVKATPSTFSYSKVPKSIPVYEYPKNKYIFRSDRLVGNVPISTLSFDQLNSRLGAAKKVNLIIVRFSSTNTTLGKYQEAKWIGGKKNDLVLCYGKGWAYVFGWTEKDIVKRNLETILLENPVNNNILPLIEAEVRRNYVIKDWDKFNYLTVDPPLKAYIILIIIMALVQGGFYFYACNNEFDK